MKQNNNLNRIMEARDHFKNVVSFKSRISRGPFFKKACFVSFVLLFTAICSTNLMAQNEISFDEFIEQASPLLTQFDNSIEEKDYQTAGNLMNETGMLFLLISKEEQEKHKKIAAEIHFWLTVCLSMQGRTIAAVDAFETAVKTYEFSKYLLVKNDPRLDHIRTDQRFATLMENVREKGDFIYLLQQSGKYQHADTTGLPSFTYEKATSQALIEVREFFNLDSIAGQGDEISKIKNLLKWVQSNIRHDGSHFARIEHNSIDIYNYHKSTGNGVNCRLLSIMLNEMYLAMGFKSRYVVCVPKDAGTDAHVINSVYSTTLNKWLWMDPTFNAYWKDESGNLLSIEEVRERVIEGRPLILNDDANRNNQDKYTKERYLDGFMAENLYWFLCVAETRFNVERHWNFDNSTLICLVPLGYEASFPFPAKMVVTNDVAYFWEH